MRFWLVSLFWTNSSDNVLRDSPLRWTIDIKRKIIWLEDRYLVSRCDDVLDVDWVKPIQNNKIVITCKDCQRWHKDTKLCIDFIVGERFLVRLSSKKSRLEIFNKITNKPQFFQKVPWKGRKKDELVIYNIHLISFILFLIFNSI